MSEYPGSVRIRVRVRVRARASFLVRVRARVRARVRVMVRVRVRVKKRRLPAWPNARWDRRLWRRLARAPLRRAAGRPVVRPLWAP